MEKLHFSIVINESKEKVWNIMLGEDTYGKWADVFIPGIYYSGDWIEGGKILFIAPDESGNISGTVNSVKNFIPFEFISIVNIGMVKDGQEDITSEEATVYAGALENYTLKDLDGSTEVLVDLFPVMEIPEDYKEMYQEMWRQALEKLKKLAEES